MPRYKRKPFEIDAIQLTSTNIVDIGDFIGEHKNFPDCKVGGIDPDTGRFLLKGVHGLGIVPVGDYIVKTPSGTFFCCAESDFMAGYELIQ